MKGLLYFVGGTLIGGAISYLMTKHSLERKYDALYQEEVDEYKRHVKNDILKADNLEAHDKKVREEAIGEFEKEKYESIVKDYSLDADDTIKVSTNVEETEKKLDELDDGYNPFDYLDDNRPRIITESEADFLECEKDYEPLYYTWENGSDIFTYREDISINVKDIFEDPTILIGYDTGDLIIIADDANEFIYTIEVL